MSKRSLLLSGGMDSIALAFALHPDLAITIDYGQQAASGEIRAASAVCAALNFRHLIVHADCRALGSGDMAGTTPISLAPTSEWWPYRNQLLITLASAAALHEGMTSVAIAAVSNDGFHADGRRAFFEAMNHVLELQEGRLVLEVPAIQDTTVSLCRRVCVPLEILAWAHSCHVSDYACGRCRGCNKHRESMRELGYGEY